MQVPASLRIPVHQGQVARPDRDQVGDETEAEAAQATRHQVGRFGVEEGPRVGDPETGIRAGRRCREDQLSLVPAGRHQAKRPGVVPVREGRERRRGHRTLRHQVQAGLGKDVGQHRIVQHQPVHVDGGEAEVPAEHAHAERVVGVDVDLADLAVPAGGAQGLEAERDVMARERIQHYVDALASRGRHQVVVPPEAV